MSNAQLAHFTFVHEGLKWAAVMLWMTIDAFGAVTVASDARILDSREESASRFSPSELSQIFWIHSS